MCIRDSLGPERRVAAHDPWPRGDQVHARAGPRQPADRAAPVSYTHLRAHETPEHLVCRLLLEKKKKKIAK